MAQFLRVTATVIVLSAWSMHSEWMSKIEQIASIPQQFISRRSRKIGSPEAVPHPPTGEVEDIPHLGGHVIGGAVARISQPLRSRTARR